MPFIPHTEVEVREMLETIGVDSIDQLFDEIPTNLKVDGLPDVPPALSRNGSRAVDAETRSAGRPSRLLYWCWSL